MREQVPSQGLSELDHLARVQTGLVLALRQVKRVPLLPGSQEQEQENDVDHSYGLLLSAWFLNDHLGLELNKEKVFKYATVHDLVEIYSGDTFAFARDGSKANKAAREAVALKQLESDWGESFPDLIDSIHAYEAQADTESRFVYALDKILPALLVHIGEGRGFWERHKITYAEFQAEKLSKMSRAPEIAHLAKALCEWVGETEFYNEE